MTTEFKRIQILRYKKSGRLIVVLPVSNIEGRIIAELESDLSAIVALSSRRYLQVQAVENTRFFADIELSQSPDRSNVSIGARLLRVVTTEDFTLGRWASEIPLSDLPVLKSAFLTPEELHWAGQRAGNLIDGIALYAATLAFAIWFAIRIAHNESAWFQGIVVAVLVYPVARFRWKFPQKPNARKLADLEAFKKRLIESADQVHADAKLEFVKALKKFSAWSALSPEQFERAVRMRLEEDGYAINLTRFSRDGGIDAEGVDHLGRSVIVQAKRYRKRVGVSIVREMIGIQHTHPNCPVVVIYSLSGFTSGARKLALEAAIVLRDARSDTMGI